MHAPEQDLTYPSPLRTASGRRRRLTAVAVALGTFACTGEAVDAAAAASTSVPRSTVEAAQARLGVHADGVVGPRTRRALRRFERAHGLRVDGRLDRGVLRALGLSTRRAASAAGGARASSSGGATPEAVAVSAPSLGPDDAALLAGIARCESGGDPAAVSPGGRYRGKYQFSRSTWKRMGGTGDPARASEAEQDARAARLLVAQGPTAWPVCSQQAAAG